MDTYMRSRIPLKLVLIGIIAAAVNFGLILGFQLLVNYRVSGTIDEAALAALDSDYEGCSIRDRAEDVRSSDKDIIVFLVETADGTEHLVTVRKHYLFDRYRLVKGACEEVPPGTKSIRLRAGTKFFTISLSFNQVSGHSDIRWDASSGQSARDSFRNGMLLSIAGLSALELAIWGLIFRKEEIA